jgi:alpha-mannosidase
MALTDEWEYRIKRWKDFFWNHLYRPLGQVELSGFVTRRQLTAAEARQEEFHPMPAGAAWGARWEYGWFKGEFTLPPEAAGRRIVLRLDTGGESLVWLNGQIAGSRGWAHKEITLAREARGGERYSLLLESYGGHGEVSVGIGPVAYGQTPVPAPGPTQCIVGQNTFGVWLEDAYQFALDFSTLFELRGLLDPLSLRVSQIDEALMEATLVVDPEQPEDELLATVRAGRARLRPLLEAVNGSTSPELLAFGHAHIDVAWLWPLAETERKMARTVINQLALFEEYPEYRFLQSQPHLYTMLRRRYPELYARFKEAVQRGRVIPDGAMWVEADTNLSGGEALVRQILYGKRFFKEELGVESKVLWLPDVFGYSGALPQILVGCGVEGFATAKITWAYGGGEPFPYNIFWWEGIDGTAIPAHIFTEYNSETSPKSVMARWNTRLQQNGVSSMVLPFGWGDGGGGPDRNHLEYLRRLRNLEGLPRLRIASPQEFFEDLERRGLPSERYVGELYFQAHRGTYTSQARTKRGNRVGELALREAELWGTAARALKGYAFDARTLEETWTSLLLNQFHDILPGSSIQRVYEEAEAAHQQIILSASSLAKEAAATFTRPGGGTTVFNSLPWARTVLVELPWGMQEVSLPACGWKTIPAPRPAEGSAAPAQAVPGAPADSGLAAPRNILLENEHLRATFDRRGVLFSLWDKDAAREILAGPANVFNMYRDVPDNWDAWDLNSMTESPALAVELADPARLELLESGPLVSRLSLKRLLHDSTLEQVILLRRGSRRLEFKTTIDWHESHKLLKVNFPLDIHTEEAVHEIQFGHLRRPNHKSRKFDADRFEVSAHKWSALVEENRGVALLNDCKYGLSVNGNSLNLTLLKAGLAPDPIADQGWHEFTYALYAWNGSFFNSGVVAEAYDLNVPPLVVPGEAGEGSLFSLDAANIVLEAVKPAEDGSSDVILRLYESGRSATACTLSTLLPVHAAWECDMLETPGRGIPCVDARLSLDFRPFEIKTVRLKL